MSEATIKSCPICGGKGIHNMTGVFTQATDFVNCAADCGMPFAKREAWNRLSDASALLRAVEVLNEAARFTETSWRIHTDHGDTLASALIALAESLTNNPA